MAGGYGAYYYTYTSWDVVRVNDSPVGYGYYRNLANFFNQTGFWLIEPSDSLVNRGHCLATPGREYVVYQPELRDFTLRVSGVSTPLAAVWFDPLTGKMIKTEPVGNGEKSFTPPPDWPNGPIVLHLGAAPFETAAFRSTFKRSLPTKDSPKPASAAAASRK
jgi:hypothetical protein